MTNKAIYDGADKFFHGNALLCFISHITKIKDNKEENMQQHYFINFTF